MAKTRKIIGLDIGSTKIACAIAESINGKYNILGYGRANPDGFRNGTVVNLDTAVDSVASAIESAEKMAGINAKNCSIYVGIAGQYIKHIPSGATVPVKNPSKGISEKDIIEVIRQAQTLRLPNDEQIIHVIPGQFIVDGQKGIKSPIGMFGFRLEVEALLIIGQIGALENIQRVLDRLEFGNRVLVLQAQALASVVSEPEDRELGIAIVDIGGLTDISIFKDGELRFYKTLPIGGENITKDIAIGLRTPYKKAEEIKKQYGTAMVSCIDQDEPIVIEDLTGRVSKQVSRRLLTSIIEPRVEEILLYTETAIRESGFADALSGGVVLTGGTAQLKGIDVMAEQVLRLPVKITPSKSTSDSYSEHTNNPIEQLGADYTTAVGLIHYGFFGKEAYVPLSESIFSSMATKLKELFA
ncbi:MAG: cell division protein FtsA [candidate division WOR-3 bacterium]|nr:cell division protein FtsA [candidate division WOR-3 bacterium]